MNLDDLRAYLKIVSKEGYATNEGFKNNDNSSTIMHVKGEWSMKDTFYGGEPYGGNEIIFYKKKPVWMMAYYGNVEKSVEDRDLVYALLKKALTTTDSEFPLRGPRMFIGQGMQYMNHWEGTLVKFKGQEQILRTGIEIYSATYMGGLIDQKTE